MDGRIFQLQNLFIEKPDHEWTVEDMAKFVDLTPAHFHRLFRENTGLSPAAYLNNLRLESAYELLKTSFSQIKQIALKTGFTDISHFTRDFKTKYGLTPTEFRRQYWDKIQSEHSNGQKS